METSLFSAFAGHRRIAHGPLADVAVAVRAHLDGKDPTPVLVFDDRNGRPVDLDLRGSASIIARRYAPTEATPPPRPGPGRPRLGVVAREVTLLPRHWDWLASQPGGASVTLRKLVEEARKSNRDWDARRQAREAAHRFMTELGGNLPGYEEALRALYAGKFTALSREIRAWPKDVREYVSQLAAPARKKKS